MTTRFAPRGLMLTVPDRPDLAVPVYTLGDPTRVCRMAVEENRDDPPSLRCDCGWETFPTLAIGYLDDLALIAAEHYRTADDPVPQPRPAVTTTT